MTKTVTQTTTESDSVTLKKSAKGDYQWEIKVYGDDLNTILDKIHETDQRLTKSYTRSDT